MTNAPPTPRQNRIAETFGDAATTYEKAGHLQRIVAQRLAKKFKEKQRPNILEIGAGTGLLTTEILRTYGDFGTLVISDLSPEKLKANRAKHAAVPHTAFALVNGEYPEKAYSLQPVFNLIATSMTVQWFENTAAGLERLRKFLTTGGELFYATLGSDYWPEWRETLESLDLQNGMIDVQDNLPGIYQRDKIKIPYGSARAFLRSLADTGTHSARPGHKPLSHKDILKACREFDRRHPDGPITWDIAYGRLTA
ncbi:MAG: methyltransferase domain-containing protein [Rhodospirillales bacterium]|nr:methyltransferase domain-containing protein [Rhodospirillales bacterium]